MKVGVAVNVGAPVGVAVALGIRVAVGVLLGGVEDGIEVAVGAGVGTTDIMLAEVLPLHPASTAAATTAIENAITARKPVRIRTIGRASGCGHLRDGLVLARSLIFASIYHCRPRLGTESLGVC